LVLSSQKPTAHPVLLDARKFNRLEQHTKITAQDRKNVMKAANKKNNKQLINV
jgi:hypothetical protein